MPIFPNFCLIKLVEFLVHHWNDKTKPLRQNAIFWGKNLDGSIAVHLWSLRKLPKAATSMKFVVTKDKLITLGVTNWQAIGAIHVTVIPGT